MRRKPLSVIATKQQEMLSSVCRRAVLHTREIGPGFRQIAHPTLTNFGGSDRSRRGKFRETRFSQWGVSTSLILGHRQGCPDCHYQAYIPYLCHKFQEFRCLFSQYRPRRLRLIVPGCSIDEGQVSNGYLFQRHAEQTKNGGCSRADKEVC